MTAIVIVMTPFAIIGLLVVIAVIQLEIRLKGGGISWRLWK